MASTFTKLLVHFVWSTKNREPLIQPRIDADLHAYIAGIAKNLDCHPYIINGTEDHVHLLVSLSKHLTVIKFAEVVKKESSKWAKAAGVETFEWQDGYAAFTIGESGVAALSQYIATQKKHHETMTFQEELVALLKKYNVPYDERYIFA